MCEWTQKTGHALYGCIYRVRFDRFDLFRASSGHRAGRPAAARLWKLKETQVSCKDDDADRPSEESFHLRPTVCLIMRVGISFGWPLPGCIYMGKKNENFLLAVLNSKSISWFVRSDEWIPWKTLTIESYSVGKYLTWKGRGSFWRLLFVLALQSFVVKYASKRTVFTVSISIHFWFSA